jgi:hypothetical protein
MVNVVDKEGNVITSMPYRELKLDRRGQVKGLGPGVQTQAQKPVGGPQLNPKQKATFDDIKKHHPGATDSQVIDYMRKKGLM